MSKICSNCKQEKDYPAFNKCKRYKDGYCIYCRECANHIRKHGVKEKRKISEIVDGNKFCRTCNRWLSANDYYKQVNNCGGLRNNCRYCVMSSDIIKRSKAKNLNCEKLSDIREWLIKQEHVCYYCGVAVEKGSGVIPTSMSVDRLEPKLGYIIGNMAVACYRCNCVKGKFLTEEQMKKVAKVLFF